MTCGITSIFLSREVGGGGGGQGAVWGDKLEMEFNCQWSMI